MSYADTRMRILRMLPKGGIGAEIGVWRGDYSERLLDIATPRKLHLIDPWAVRMDPNYDAAWYGKARGVDMEATYQQVCARFAAEIKSGQVAIHRKLSTEAMAEFPDGALDYVYVDGDHAYEAVRQDLELSVHKVRTGGAICVDDHMVGKWWGDGVVRAVNEVLGRYPTSLQMVFCADSQVVIVKREDLKTSSTD